MCLRVLPVIVMHQEECSCTVETSWSTDMQHTFLLEDSGSAFKIDVHCSLQKPASGRVHVQLQCTPF